MSERRLSSWKSLILAAALLAVPMLATAASPPVVVYPNSADAAKYPAGIGFNPVVDYTKPNFSQSPNIRKFVDSLPGLGAANKNNLGQYIPVATPDTTTYPGDAASSSANPASDYYEIELTQYNEKMHSDLPPSTLRGYAQVNSADPTVNGVHQYLGPLVIAKTYDPSKPAGQNGNGKPVRFKFFNRLPIGAAGNLPLPVDMTVMGAGMGPLGGTEMYTQTRATIHLHGGVTPWISDGTPHQWLTPAGEVTSYPKGVAFQNVPDMVNGSPVPCRGGATCFTPVASDGIGTYYYTNEQSARLMFYHDHAYGITRLNVYSGMAAGYLLTDQYEEDMISGTNVYGVNPTNAKLLPDLGGVYHYGIPLVIQDKSFVNDAATPSATAKAAFPATGYVPTPKTLGVDPLWAYYTPPYDGVAGMPGGSLWFPHEYMPVENPFDPSGNTPNGRWDYAPFMIPPMQPLNVTLPSPTLIPEGFMDTAVVNGTAFPYLELPPDAVRFRILNACNDRTLNLQLYKADPANPTEVKMVDAVPIKAFPTWPKDGRDGGVPDPLTKGPDWIQIGNEGGFLAKVAVIPAQPIDFNYNRQVIPLAGVTSKSLLLMPAVRADVVVDLSAYKDGDTLIVYNDAPAAMPNYWPLNDYYSDGPDQTATGGPVTIPPGFGPNTRTLMQIRIKGTKNSNLDFSSPNGATLAALQNALPKVFAASQDPILVPQLAYNAAYPSGPHHLAGTTDNYVQAYQTTMNISGSPQPLSKIMTMAAGNNYTTPPTVVISGGFPAGCVAPTCVNATATAGLNPIGGITLLTAGSGYTTPPTVTLGAPGAGGVQATAVATVSGGIVNAITIVEPGSNYTNTVTAPTCTVSAPTGVGGVTATCSVMVPTLNTVGSITITNPGAGYTSEPLVYLIPAAGSNGQGATAVAMLNGTLAMTGKNMTEGFDVEYGRMDIKLGSTPNPLTPAVGNGFVLGIARYIDPPTEILNDGETILWRLAHLGVDSHAMHFHLFNVQVVNHVDWTGVIKPPYDDEIGWKETIRTNPMEDIILAIRPKSMVLPFTIPDSVRVLDPTTPVNSTTNFYPVAPPAGVPAVAQLSNVMTNFGWEYVWHCHLLGHEENDMMRPMVLLVASAVPPAPTLLSTGVVGAVGKVTVTWTVPATTTSNAPNGFLVQRATGSKSTAFTTIATINDKTVLSYLDTTVGTSTVYRYRILAFNEMGNSAASAIRNITTTTWTSPTVSISAPLTGATFTTPATIPITATATAGGTATISKVEFYNGSSLIATDTSSPYSFSFTGVNAGTCVLTAKVYNSLGLVATSAPVTVAVNAPPSPTVSILTPLAGATFTDPATISLTANASAPQSTVTRIDYYNGAALLGSATTSPYTFNWTNVGPGSYTLTAVVHSGYGASSVSAPVTVSVITSNVTVMTAPANGSTLTGSSQTFSWNNSGANLYQLWVGSTPGTYDIGAFPAAGTTGTSTTASGLPVNGSTLYVRLWSQTGGTWSFSDYVYTASGTLTPAAMISPANNSTLTGASQAFTWSNAGANLYQIWVGSSLGGMDIGAFPAAGTTITSTTATGLPVNGAPVYVRLWSRFGTSWVSNDYSYTATGAFVPAALTSPANASILTGLSTAGGSVPFTWSNASANLYQIWMGTTLGAFDIGAFPSAGTTATSATATGLPALTIGSTVYVRLWSKVGANWYANDYTFTSGI